MRVHPAAGSRPPPRRRTRLHQPVPVLGQEEQLAVGRRARGWVEDGKRRKALDGGPRHAPAVEGAGLHGGRRQRTPGVREGGIKHRSALCIRPASRPWDAARARACMGMLGCQPPLTRTKSELDRVPPTPGLPSWPQHSGLVGLAISLISWMFASSML